MQLGGAVRVGKAGDPLQLLRLSAHVVVLAALERVEQLDVEGQAGIRDLLGGELDGALQRRGGQVDRLPLAPQCLVHLTEDLDVLDAVGAELGPAIGVVARQPAAAAERLGGRLRLGEAVDEQRPGGGLVLALQRLGEALQRAWQAEEICPVHGVDPLGGVEVLAGGAAVRVRTDLDAVERGVVSDLGDPGVSDEGDELLPQRRVVTLGGRPLGDLHGLVVERPHGESDAGFSALGVAVRAGRDVDVGVGLGV